MRPIDAVSLSEGIDLHRQSTDQECEMDRQWAVGYNAGLDRALYSIACAKTITPPPNDPLMVLPCKVGDTVWTNIAIVGDRYKSADRPYLVEVVFIGLGEGKRFFHVQYSNGRVFPFDFEQVGKTVFLTREEAKAALKKREADNEKSDSNRL